MENEVVKLSNPNSSAMITGVNDVNGPIVIPEIMTQNINWLYIRQNGVTSIAIPQTNIPKFFTACDSFK